MIFVRLRDALLKYLCFVLYYTLFPVVLQKVAEVTIEYPIQAACGDCLHRPPDAAGEKEESEVGTPHALAGGLPSPCIPLLRRVVNVT